MSYRNPTALRIGMSGMIEGLRYTVLGRVTLGVDVEGETYYWEEFYLGNEEGGTVTLVFEETDTGPTWKLFKDFDPPRPLTVAEAQAKRPDEMIELGGVTARISLVDSSRVYHIEGAAPEGVEVGDVADYFNADYAGGMVVVSWTGDEVEYYKGRDLSRRVVESAFGLSTTYAPGAGASAYSGGSTEWALGSLSGRHIGAVIAGVGFAFFFVFSMITNGCERNVRHPEPAPKASAPSRPLPVGVEGDLGGHRYAITGYALVEVSQVMRRFDRHEYVLKDGAGQQALLVQGLNGNTAIWHLLTPANPPAGFTPYDAAALRGGGSVSISGHAYQIRQLYQASALNLEGTSAANAWPSKITYGFVAAENDDWLVARWSETDLQLYAGRAFPAKDVLAALNKVP